MLRSNELRFDYASYRTYARAEMALEDMFASGEVDLSDNPEIETRRTLDGRRYVISLAG